MMGLGPQCYIPKFMEIGPLVQEKNFLGFFTIYGRDGHLGHVTNIILQHFHFQVPKSLHKKLVKNCPVASEKRKF